MPGAERVGQRHGAARAAVDEVLWDRGVRARAGEIGLGPDWPVPLRSQLLFWLLLGLARVTGRPVGTLSSGDLGRIDEDGFIFTPRIKEEVISMLREAIKGNGGGITPTAPTATTKGGKGAKSKR